jgi:predicted nuclease with TOPRIM domain
MSKKEAELLNEIEKLKASFLSFQKKIEELTTENQRLEELNRYLKLLKFGVKKIK